MILDQAIYSALEDEARARSLCEIPMTGRSSPERSHSSADIWTNDNDFLGTGVATWTTRASRHGSAGRDDGEARPSLDAELAAR